MWGYIIQWICTIKLISGSDKVPFDVGAVTRRLQYWWDWSPSLPHIYFSGSHWVSLSIIFSVQVRKQKLWRGVNHKTKSFPRTNQVALGLDSGKQQKRKCEIQRWHDSGWQSCDFYTIALSRTVCSLHLIWLPNPNSISWQSVCYTFCCDTGLDILTAGVSQGTSAKGCLWLQNYSNWWTEMTPCKYTVKCIWWSTFQKYLADLDS